MKGPWCKVCGCDLPTQRDGTVLKSTRRAHNQGQRHIKNVNLEQQQSVRSLVEYLRRERVRCINDMRQALLLAVTATRLRATHGSMDGARTAWAVESDLAISQISNPSLKAALCATAEAHVAQHHVRSAASDAWLVVKLVIDIAGI